MAAEEPPSAGQNTSQGASAAPESPPSPQFPPQSSRAVGSSGISSLSPQPSMQLQPDVSHRQQEQDLPGRAALAAQTAASSASLPAQLRSRPAAEEQPWQEVRTSRRRPISQQAAFKASTCRAAQHGRGVPQEKPHPPTRPDLADFKAATHRSGVAPQTPNKAPAPQHAESAPVAAEQWQDLLQVSTGSSSQQFSHHEDRSFVQRPQPQASPFSMQHESLLATADGTMPHELEYVSEQLQVLPPGLCAGSFSFAEVCRLACLSFLTV